MSTIAPQFHKLSQRTVGQRLYDEVERNIKPQLIRNLKTCLATSSGGQGIVHVSIDLWAGASSHPLEEPTAAVQLHFLDENWQICRPVVAFRHINPKNLSASVAGELEGVLLSYGLFSHNIGYVLTNQAKEAVMNSDMFCDYKLLFQSHKGDPDAEEMAAFIADQLPETGKCPFSDLQIGTRASCVVNGLQLVIKEALKISRVVENLLSQVHNVVAFFRTSSYWSEVGRARYLWTFKL